MWCLTVNCNNVCHLKKCKNQLLSGGPDSVSLLSSPLAVLSHPLSLSLCTDTNAYTTCLLYLSSGCPISLSALLSLQLGTCTTILTSRGLLPAPNTLLPSVSLMVSSTVECEPDSRPHDHHCLFVLMSV